MSINHTPKTGCLSIKCEDNCYRLLALTVEMHVAVDLYKVTLLDSASSRRVLVLQIIPSNRSLNDWYCRTAAMVQRKCPGAAQKMPSFRCVPYISHVQLEGIEDEKTGVESMACSDLLTKRSNNIYQT